MSDALVCDGPECGAVSGFPPLGWWQLAPAPPLLITGAGHRLDFCSWECLGAFVFAQAADMAELQARIDRLADD